MSLDRALEYARDERAGFVDRLKDWLAIPSVSPDPAHAADMRRAADWLVEDLSRLGLEGLCLLGQEERPVVYAEYNGAGPDAPTVLVYGHYDVQPPEPLDLWESPPFMPEIRGDYLFARGVGDMKGQVLSTVFAVESLIKKGGLPINVKFLIEGEEEVGSPGLPTVLEEHRELLRADVCLNPDCGMPARGVPTVTYAVRGCATFELRVTGPHQDIHSGLFGGTLHNPAQVLCDLVAALHDADGRVTLPGFYDSVRELEADEREALARLPLDEAAFLEKTGVPALWGEDGFTPIERVGGRPTLEVNGMISGHVGAGVKTIVPSWALVKLSSRLVPDQDPETVEAQLEAFLEERVPPTVRWELESRGYARPALCDHRSPWTRAMLAAHEAAWGRSTLSRGGGSLPVIGQLQDILGVDSVNVGCCLPDDNAHGPNEKLHLPTWETQIESLIRFFSICAARSP